MRSTSTTGAKIRAHPTSISSLPTAAAAAAVSLHLLGLTTSRPQHSTRQDLPRRRFVVASIGGRLWFRNRWTRSSWTSYTVKDVLGRWGEKAAETTKKGQDLAGNMWQDLKTGPSFADAAVGRIAQGTKVLAEGGYEKIIRNTFETIVEEQLLKSYACYLSTSAGPVMGDQTEWSYYKVVIPWRHLKAVNPSTSRVNTAEKYIQAISVDNHEFWFMGFVQYDSAVKNLQGSVPPQTL
ncbi:hypothetical protein MLD38_001993 [Melastoma candidum]|uniref:Uncharacterized protein n=1 Tax=Melastoma candidum TaxID=119954 RepID=A0ACB9SIA7_9MYRT|nr:hypothetical protein MLD38_001993 [Melastoma candidum]